MSIILVNKTNRMKVIPLPHESYCEAQKRCSCVQLPGMKNKVPTSLTIPAGASSKELPEAILCVGQIARMIRRGELEAVVQQQHEAKSKTKKQKRGRKTQN